jgi:hypothetical protein
VPTVTQLQQELDRAIAEFNRATSERPLALQRAQSIQAAASELAQQYRLAGRPADQTSAQAVGTAAKRFAEYLSKGADDLDEYLAQHGL